MTTSTSLDGSASAFTTRGARPQTAAAGGPDGAAPAAAAPRRWRAVVSALCLVLASILLPLSIVAAWARVELVDEDQFVAALAPVVDDPAVQAMIAGQVSAAVAEHVDIPAVTDDLFDGLAGLDLPPRAAAGLELLRAPVAQGVQGLVDQTITRLVASDAFADLWAGAVRAAHRAVVTAGTGETSGAISISAAGAVGIELGPIVAEVKNRLIDRGIGIASAIPEVDRTIVVAQNDALVTVRTVYALTVAVGWILPVLTLALFVAGVAVARRRSTALLGAGVGAALAGVALLLGSAVARTLLSLQGTADVPPAAVVAVYDQVTTDMRQTAVVVVTLGLVVAALAWVHGRWRGARAVRAFAAATNDALRRRAQGLGVRFGGVSVFLDRQRMLVRTAIVALALVWLWVLRPLSVAEVVIVSGLALLVWWACELARPPMPAARTAHAAE